MISKKAINTRTTLCLLPLFLLASCKISTDESILTTIPVATGTSNLKASGTIRIMGFTRLDVSGMEGINRFRGISKVLFDEDRIIVFDNVSDFQNIWLFDAGTGSMKGKALLEGAGREISDIAVDGEGNIMCLAPGKRSFLTYDQQGNLLASRLNGVIGDGILPVQNNRTLVYNEYSATDISGYYQLIYFDQAGNVVNRLYPYARELDNIAYTLSGFVSQSDGKYWFSPPFCDTIYELKGFDILPRYLFDFGSKSVPDEVRGRKIQSGWAVHNFAYLSESFLKIGDNVVFEYYMDRKMHLAFYNERTHQLSRFADILDACSGNLLHYGQLFAKDENSIALVLTAAQIRKMTEQQKIDLTAMRRCYPSLADALHDITYSESADPVVLYLALAP